MGVGCISSPSHPPSKSLYRTKCIIIIHHVIPFQQNSQHCSSKMVYLLMATFSWIIYGGHIGYTAVIHWATQPRYLTHVLRVPVLFGTPCGRERRIVGNIHLYQRKISLTDSWLWNIIPRYCHFVRIHRRQIGQRPVQRIHIHFSCLRHLWSNDHVTYEKSRELLKGE